MSTSDRTDNNSETIDALLGRGFLYENSVLQSAIKNWVHSKKMESDLIKSFNPISGKPGELRISLSLSALGDRAGITLFRCQELGFDKPRFEIDSRGDVWAIIYYRIYPPSTDLNSVMELIDKPLDELRAMLGEQSDRLLIALVNLGQQYAHFA
jgi:hypothetical protein